MAAKNIFLLAMLFFLVQIFLFSIPFQFAVPMGTEDIPLLRLGALGLLLLSGVKILLERNKIFLPVLFLFLLLGWLLLMTLSLLLSSDISLGTRRLIFLWNLFPLVLVWSIFLNEEKTYSLIKALIMGAVFSALLGLGIFLTQFFLGVETAFYFLTKTALPFFLGEHLGNLVATYPSLLVNIGGATWLRVTAFFPDPHVASFFFGITACLAFGLFLDTKEKFFLYSGGLLLLADVLTFSRGGYLGLLAAFLLYFLVQKSKWGVKPLIGIMAFLPLLLWLGMPVYERFFSVFALADASSVDRLLLWRTAWETILQYPWFGLGLGNYSEWVHPGFGANIPYYAHNLYLDIAVEGGMISLLLFLGISVSALIQSFRRAIQGSGVALGVSAALFLYLVHSFFETALFSIHVTALLSLLFALAFAHVPKKSPVE